MSRKDQLHELVEKLPENEWETAHRLLDHLCHRQGDPLLRALEAAPEDYEPETPEEAAAVERAREQLARGELIPDEELWKRLGHEPPESM